MNTSNIADSTYNPSARQVTTNFSGQTDMPTKFYLFYEDAGAIIDLLVDVPQFSGSTQAVFTLPGALDHIVVSPASAAVATGGSQQFTAQGYDASNNPIPNLSFAWAVLNGGGTINSSGLFTAGSTPGTYANTVAASTGGVTGYASVTVVPPILDHFTFANIASPQYVNTFFQVTLSARDISGNLITSYNGHATLSASAGTITPNVTENFSGGTWAGTVSLSQVASNVTITASDGAVTSTSNSFTVQAGPQYYQVSSTSSSQAVNVPFTVTVTAFQTRINCWEDNHQDPVLPTTTNSADLIPNDGKWTEFQYSGRPFPGVFASVDETSTLPIMRFYASGIPNGQYQVIANLFTSDSERDMRYYYGYTPGNVRAYHVDTVGGSGGSTQFTEYNLGTITITDNTFNIYVKDADLLSGTYSFFGWAWIHLSPTGSSVTLSSSSPTMLFDANGNGVFGESGDNVKALVNGTFSIQARDSATSTGVSITATDNLGQSGSNTYNISSPTAVTLSSFTARTASDNAASRVTLNWTTATEIKTAGFNLYRSERADGPYTRINVQLIPGSGDSLTGGKYEYQDTKVVVGQTYYYQLEDVEFDGTSMRHKPIGVTVGTASETGISLELVAGLGLGLLVIAAGAYTVRKRLR
jgi:hypothetical protein